MASENWHENAFFGLHYDLHPNAKDTQLGEETTYEHIRAMLEKVKPDFVQYDCKGHPGWSGYPTKIGSPSPGIVNDALRVWREVTRDMGIPLSIHYSGVWDTRAIELHPEWARINERGKPDPNYTSRLSGYAEELMIPQLLEVIQEYDIDGMWIDGENWASLPDWSEACQALFTEKTGITEIPRRPNDPYWDEWLAFHRELFVTHVKRYVEAVHAVKPSCMVTSNWMYSVRQPEEPEAPIDYLSGDFDWSFGSERAMAEARFISSRGKPWDLMAWAFLQTNNQGWTLKTAVHLCQEVSTVLAQGGAIFIYNTPQRTGRLTEWHQDILAEVAQFCRKRQPVCHKTVPIPQVAVLHSESSYYKNNSPLFNFGSANHAMEGAMFALLENGYSVDILNEATLARKMNDYPMIVIPEAAYVPQDFRSALQSYVREGGKIVLTGAHVAEMYEELAGVQKTDKPPRDGWLPAGNGAVRVHGLYQPIQCTTATELAFLLYEQDPERNRLDFPASTLNLYGKGSVVAIHGPIFENYYNCRYPLMRRFIGDSIKALGDEDLIRLEGPWYIEMAARTKDDKILIQLVNRSVSGYLSPSRHIVEHVPDAGPFTLHIPMATKPRRCYAAPDPVGVEWNWHEGTLSAHIGGLSIHNVLVIE